MKLVAQGSVKCSSGDKLMRDVNGAGNLVSEIHS